MASAVTMQPVAGHGGTLEVTSKAVVGGAATYFFEVVDWKITKTAVLAEVTDSSTLGYQKRKRVVKGGQWSANFIWSATNIPESDSTLDQGNEITCRFNMGKTTPQRSYTFPAIIETLEITDDNAKDVVKGTVSGFINGAITNPVNGTVTETY